MLKQIGIFFTFALSTMASSTPYHGGAPQYLNADSKAKALEMVGALKIGDKFDYRNDWGAWHRAIVTDKNDYDLWLTYIHPTSPPGTAKLSKDEDVVSIQYNVQWWRFASFESICVQEPTHEFTLLKKGDWLDVRFDLQFIEDESEFKDDRFRWQRMQVIKKEAYNQFRVKAGRNVRVFRISDSDEVAPDGYYTLNTDNYNSICKKKIMEISEKFALQAEDQHCSHTIDAIVTARLIAKALNPMVSVYQRDELTNLKTELIQFAENNEGKIPDWKFKAKLQFGNFEDYDSLEYIRKKFNDHLQKLLSDAEELSAKTQEKTALQKLIEADMTREIIRNQNDLISEIVKRFKEETKGQSKTHTISYTDFKRIEKKIHVESCVEKTVNNLTEKEFKRDVLPYFSKDALMTKMKQFTHKRLSLKTKKRILYDLSEKYGWNLNIEEISEMVEKKETLPEKEELPETRSRGRTVWCREGMLDGLDDDFLLNKA